MLNKILILVVLLPFAFVNGQDRYAEYPKSDFFYDAQDWNSNTLSEIEEKFNEARYHEELDLGVDLPEFRLPNSWASFKDAEKVLWIINKERRDRGLSVIDEVNNKLNRISEKNLVRISLENQKDFNNINTRKYFLLDVDKLQENEYFESNYTNEFDRIENNNLLCFELIDKGSPIIEMFMYNFLYADSENNWRSRDFILNTRFEENGGKPYKEGLIGFSLLNVESNFEDKFVSAFSLIFLDPGKNWNYKPFETMPTSKLDFDISTSSSTLTINVNEKSDSLRVEIYNLIGQQLINEKIDYGINNTFFIDGSRGYYLVKVKSNNKQKAVKVYIP